MAWWGSSGKDGTLFIDCMKPVVKFCKALPGPAKVVGVAVIAAAAVGVGAYVIAKKVQDPKKTP